MDNNADRHDVPEWKNENYPFIYDKETFNSTITSEFDKIVKRNTHRLKPNIFTEYEIEEEILKIAIHETNKLFKQKCKESLQRISFNELIEKNRNIYDSSINVTVHRIKERMQVAYQITIPNLNHPERNCPNFFSPKMTMIFAYCHTLTQEEHELAKHYLQLIKKKPRCIWNKEDDYVPTCRYLIRHQTFKRLHKTNWQKVSKDFLNYLINLK